MAVDFYDMQCNKPKEYTLRNNSVYKQRGQAQAILLAQSLVAAVLLAWITHSSLQLVDYLSEPSSSSSSASLSGQPSKRPLLGSSLSSIPTSVDIQAIKSIPLFGEVVEAAIVEPEPEVQPEAIVETKLNLLLKGLFSSDDESGRAIIANGRQELLYRVGDNIEGLSNVKLVAVFFDRITLDNHGTREVLYLYPESERLAASQTSSVAITNEDKMTAQLAPTYLTENAINNTASTKKAKRLNEIIHVVNARDKVSGNMLGFRVLPGRDRASFEKSGLQANDIILSIDGDKLTDLRTARSIYFKKNEAANVALIIRRGDSELSLDIDLEALAI